MIEDHPIDTDVLQPMAPSREGAMALLEALIPDRAQELWDALLKPLYDRQRYVADYPRGVCRRCGVPHPQSQRAVVRTSRGLSCSHRIYCDKYVGPLTHGWKSSDFGVFGMICLCVCGKSYPEWADEEARIKGVCPDILFVWRGPRPDESQEGRMAKDKDEQQEPQVAPEGTVGDSADSPAAPLIAAEQKRLEDLQEGGHVGEDNEADDHQPNDEDEQGREGETFHR